ncbi:MULTISPECIES: DNA integrity scanning diadenylate cyclase DisA [Brevibacillus]|jgi:diadenylate cyclase|uniref:diadenylate cyclase n=1 Tax=Brevibacillus borstelensis AK1 TaxID=1300222 RepID=M8DAM3_9BACL|nr:DNA integrity scanning diadenylate cyclase DisA [Brevibacillus borstelensis]EMT50367.1 DNA integrity scanning protein DisA [Brevibacillus borstelensis AK1]KKX54623.1 DNA integrity scanning protein DisA [Brevibacillus borstelensis cifa_chp40]MBE5395156.1 DNA integrity scanning protein DisA [Brevibacillus borstelensis]MCC0565332.1 DNA integrity scanning diadenylate cyclase DisA [Brevibacillus borstelensis]MCM3472926.1 DNA integrity scanning diadenylate cyclase DisA [Brevibacillus borstelensis
MLDTNKREPVYSDVLRLVAPGTPLREGLENVLRAKTGGLIVVGFGPDMKNIVDGGFSINCDFTPAHLYELAKMDGAIIVSEDAKKILYANTQLFPPAAIPSSETGTRHRTAQRTALHTNYLVIAISQRRNVITLYQGPFRYVLNEISVILAKANQAISTLEKYKAVLDQTLTNLGALEFEELVTLHEVTSVLQRIEMVLRIKAEITKYIYELGTEGRLVTMQLEELVGNIEEEAHMLIRDYAKNPAVQPEQVLKEMKKLSAEEVLEMGAFLRILGYSANPNMLEESLSPRGYRILHKIPRLPISIISNLVEHFHNLPRIMMATIEELDEVDGIGEVRARAIKDGLKRIQEQVFIDRHI